MHAKQSGRIAGLFVVCVLFPLSAWAQLGKAFESERKVLKDPATGHEIVFLTSKPRDDSKIYPTHPQWTSDGRWVVFRSKRVEGEAMAVHEDSGRIVQVTHGGFSGMLVLARKSMRLFFLQPAQPSGSAHLMEVDLEKLFADVSASTVGAAERYQRSRAFIPAEMNGGDLALDADESTIYFRLASTEAAKHLSANTVLKPAFGPRNMGAGPSGIAAVDLSSGRIRVVAALPFQVGHIQANPSRPGELIFCWETGGKSPQRMWSINADGSNLRPLFPESEFDWVTHEVVVSADEVAFAILGHRAVGTKDAWGPSGTRERPTGMAILNLRTNETQILGQTRAAGGFWHVHASPDGNWAVADDFDRNLWLIDRHTNEMMVLSSGHKTTAQDHVHPTFSADSRKIQIQSAMLSEDGRTMNIAILKVPDAWLNRYRTPTSKP
jgi:oligogalacturonide lyase